MRMFADVLVTIHSMQLLMLLIVGIVHHTESKSKPIERLEVKATMCPGLVSSEGAALRRLNELDEFRYLRLRGRSVVTRSLNCCRVADGSPEESRSQGQDSTDMTRKSTYNHQNFHIGIVVEHWGPPAAASSSLPGPRSSSSDELQRQFSGSRFKEPVFNANSTQAASDVENGHIAAW
ncbi:hypothetical protein AXG93_2190s1250 [Marchantia polymorpha subsp. ruderalis]|nr:hypothetical protein AXG93_2190s1250 [Marchantia polymorpha subsp. ruderalis]